MERAKQAEAPPSVPEGLPGVVSSPDEDKDNGWSSSVTQTKQHRASQVKVNIDALDLTKDELELLKRVDKEGNGDVSLKEVIKFSREDQANRRETALLRKVVGIFALFIVLLSTGVFMSSYAAVELTKEMKSSSGGKIIASSGEVAKMSSADFSIKNGQMLLGDGSCDSSSGRCRRLADGTTTGATVATAQVLEKRLISSSLPSSFFDALSEVTVVSDRGFTLNIKVSGFSRVPVLHSRCGNLVTLYTSWGGKVVLDDSELSFDSTTADIFKGAGFSVLIGGVGGRRLAGENSVNGFFHHIQELAEEGAWRCQNVPLPKLPRSYRKSEVHYFPCQDATDESKLSPCESLYGGFVPGAGKLESKHAMATVGKATYFQMLAGRAVDVREKLFARTETEVLKSSGWELQVDRYAGHPGQEKVYLYSRNTQEAVHFQHVRGVADSRVYCRLVPKAENPQAKWQEAENNGELDTDMHFEFMDIVEEEGVLYRHFRMMPSEKLMEWSGAKPPTERPEGTDFEYWDDANSLAPYRMMLPDGTMVVFKSVQEGVTDTEVVSMLKRYGIDPTSPMTCPEDAPEDANEEAPEMLSPLLDTSRKDVDYYRTWQDTVVAADAVLQNEDFSAFDAYAERKGRPMSMPDTCRKACAREYDAMKIALSDEAGSSCTQLMDLVNCLEIQPVKSCGNSYFVMNSADEILDCESASGRRLVSSPPTKRAPEQTATYSNVLPADRASILKDGSTVVELSSLSEGDRQVLAKMLKIPEFSSGRVIFNRTAAVTSEPAVLETVEHGVQQQRRLTLASNCLAQFKNTFTWHWMTPSCWDCAEMCMNFGCDCSPTSTKVCYPGCQQSNRYFSAYLKIVLGKRGPTLGAIEVSAGGSLDIGTYFGIPKPLTGSASLSGSILVSTARPCPSVPISFSGKVSIGISLGIDLWGMWGFTLANLQLTAGGGVTTYKYNCRGYDNEGGGRRRWWSRRRWDTVCDEACDVNVYAIVEASINIWVAGVKGWVKIEYYFRHKDVQLTVGADAFVGPWASWFSLISVRIV